MAKLIAYFQRRARQAQVRKELSRMDDRELQDIGLSRYDINRIVNETT